MANWIVCQSPSVKATNMATGLAAFSSISATLSSPNAQFPLTLLRSSSFNKTYQEDISQSSISRKHWLNGLCLTPSLPPSPSITRKVEVSSYLPPSPIDPSFAVFKDTSKDTPALCAGAAYSRYSEIRDEAVTQCQAKITLAHSSSVELRKGEALTFGDGYQFGSISRRDVLGLAIGFSSILLFSCSAEADGLPPEQKPKLCDDGCEKELENIPMVTTESGLQYKDIKVGGGPSPPVGFQVAANYVAMVPSGQIFDSSLEKGLPYIFRVGAGLVIKGLDEGILSMKVGGKRRLYIPGPLAFPKGLNSAPGRPRVAPNSPVIFDVSLEYIPGLESDEE